MWWVVAAALCLAGCGLFDEQQPADFTRVSPEVPSSTYVLERPLPASRVSWSDFGLVIDVNEEEPEGFRGLVAVTESGLDPVEIDLGPSYDCDLPSDRIRELDTGLALAASRTCLPARMRGNPSSAFVLELGGALRIVSEMDEPIATRVSVAPDGSRAIADMNSDLCASLMWLEAEGMVVRDVKVGDGSRAWSLADYWENREREARRLAESDPDPAAFVACDEVGGLAGWPAWRPDGETIAFFVSPQSLDRSGFARLGVELELWFMGPDGEDPHRVAGGFHDLGGVRWSPNGQCLGFSGRPQGGAPGVWVYVLDEETMVQVAGSGLGWSWSPDGTAIVHLEQESVTLEPVERYTIYEIGEVPELNECVGRASDAPTLQQGEPVSLRNPSHADESMSVTRTARPG